MPDSTPERAADPSPEALEFAHSCRWPDSRVDLARLLDDFSRKWVEKERERCFAWAIGRRSRSRAAQAIRDGDDPHGHPLDPSLCWRCGVALHPGHFCSGTKELQEAKTVIRGQEVELEGQRDALTAAKRAGAEAMRERAVQACFDLMDEEVDRAALDLDAHHYCEAFAKVLNAVRALPTDTDASNV